MFGLDPELSARIAANKTKEKELEVLDVDHVFHEVPTTECTVNTHADHLDQCDQNGLPEDPVGSNSSLATLNEGLINTGKGGIT